MIITFEMNGKFCPMAIDAESITLEQLWELFSAAKEELEK